jgi:hypothetical protein
VKKFAFGNWTLSEDDYYFVVYAALAGTFE